MKRSSVWMMVHLLWIAVMPLVAAGKPDTAALDTYLKQAFEENAYPGLSVVMVHQGRTVYANGFGVAVVGEDRPMTADTTTAIGSVTKSMTALCVMRLVEQGKIDMDQPVITYLPAFRTADKDRSDRITVRMLLGNTSGMPSLDHGITDRNQNDDAADGLVASLAGRLLHREPGSGFEYANEGFVVAGQVAAKVHGKPFPQTLADLVLKPLAMKRSSSVPAEIAGLDGLMGHLAGADAGLPARQRLASLQYAAAGSLLQCSVRDFGNYLAALQTGRDAAGTPFVSAASTAEMWRGHVTTPESERMGAFDYGLGWMTGQVDGRRVVAHGGHALTMTTYAMMVPEQDLAVAVFANIETLDVHRYSDLPTLANNSLHIAMGEPVSDFGRPKSPDKTRNDFELDPAQAARFVGHFEARGLGTTGLTVTRTAEGALAVTVMEDGHVTKAGVLDFINPARSVIRGIGNPVSLIWRLSREGEVLSVRYSGARLRRNDVAKHQADAARIQAGRFSLIPAQGWRQANDASGLLVHQGRNRLWTGLVAATATPLAIAEQHGLVPPNAENVSAGAETGVMIGPHYWRKTAIRVPRDRGPRQVWVLRREVGEKVLAWVLTCDGDSLTQVFQSEARHMLTSLVLTAKHTL